MEHLFNLFLLILFLNTPDKSLCIYFNYDEKVFFGVSDEDIEKVKMRSFEAIKREYQDFPLKNENCNKNMSVYIEEHKGTCKITVSITEESKERLKREIFVGCSLIEILNTLQSLKIKKSITIFSQPSEADVFDSKGDFLGVTPIRLSELETSKLNLILKKSGYNTKEVEIDLDKSPSAFTVKLETTPSLIIYTEPDNIVYVDGNDFGVGNTMRRVIYISKGHHKVLTKGKCGEREKEVNLQSDKVEIDMRTAGIIRIKTSPPQCNLTLSNNRTGEKFISSTPFEKELCSNEWSATLENQHFNPKHQTLIPTAGSLTEFFIKLEPREDVIERLVQKKILSSYFIYSGIAGTLIGAAILLTSQVVLHNTIEKNYGAAGLGTTLLAGLLTFGIGGATATTGYFLKPDVPDELKQFIE